MRWGGNALQRDGEASSEAQQRVADWAVSQLVPLVEAGHRVAVVHGNGPQVGNIVLHEEAINTPEVPSLPLEDSGAMSQGLIGFWLQQAFHDAFKTQGLQKKAVSVVTQTVVDGNDPAFQAPSKPIGPFYSAEEAERVKNERGYTVKEDAGRGWRRVVPSPRPQEIVEAEVIKMLVKAGVVVVSTGGGGIPVLRAADGTLSGVEAVIDKDFSAAVVAETLHADRLIILTAVEEIAINFGKPDQTALRQVSVDEIEKHAADGHFAPGSMLPKVQAAAQFIRATGHSASIGSLDRVADILDGTSGTTITP